MHLPLGTQNEQMNNCTTAASKALQSNPECWMKCKKANCFVSDTRSAIRTSTQSQSWSVCIIRQIIRALFVQHAFKSPWKWNWYNFCKCRARKGICSDGWHKYQLQVAAEATGPIRVMDPWATDFSPASSPDAFYEFFDDIKRYCIQLFDEHIKTLQIIIQHHT